MFAVLLLHGTVMGATAVPRINGPYVRVYIPGEDVFPGPDSENFKTGQSYKEWVPNDHAILKGPDGCWHALGITHPKPFGNSKNVHEAEWLLFHAIAPKGKLKAQMKEGTWRDAKKVLAPAARPGEIKECYAPFIVPKDGLYYMIYGPTAMRLATSPNLFDWKTEGALFAERGGIRDPNVFLHNAHYNLVYIAYKSLFVRTSTDLLNWSEKPVEIFSMRRGGSPESPSIVQRDGQFYLFWCLWDAADQVNGAYDNRTYVFRSTNPLDFKDAPCVAELKAHAPEIFRDEDGDWFISSVEWPHRGVSIAPLVWE
jgi:beta-fructofuranosidase